jgi:hypothetical protein
MKEKLEAVCMRVKEPEIIAVRAHNIADSFLDRGLAERAVGLMVYDAKNPPGKKFFGATLCSLFCSQFFKLVFEQFFVLWQVPPLKMNPDGNRIGSEQ